MHLVICCHKIYLHLNVAPFSYHLLTAMWILLYQGVLRYLRFFEQGSKLAKVLDLDHYE